ncbi:MAG TPA: hypothetical protein VMU62_04195 [Acidobacteriaceae bacterium]|nr:hypothetical protein [Acidobacteriaceae bacterium]
MTRSDLLRALIRQAKENGFEFRKWYTNRLALPWTSFEDSVNTLANERRYYSLLFSHEFALSFWKPGSKMTFVVPTSSYTRVTKNGQVITVQRRGHTRRTAQVGVWRYHLRQMVVTEDPLRYIRRFLLLEEDIQGVPLYVDTDEVAPTAADAVSADEGTYADTYAEMEKMDYGEDLQLLDEDTE